MRKIINPKMKGKIDNSKGVIKKKRIAFILMVFAIFIAINIISFIFMKTYDVGYDIQSYYVFLGVIPFCICLYIILLLIKSKTWKILYLPIFLLFLKISIILINGYTPFIADSLIFFSMTFSLLFNILQYFLQFSTLQSSFSEILIHLFALFFYQSTVLILARKTCYLGNGSVVQQSK